MRVALILIPLFILVILLPWIAQPILSVLAVIAIYLTYTGIRLFILAIAAIPALLVIKKVWRS